MRGWSEGPVVQDQLVTLRLGAGCTSGLAAHVHQPLRVPGPAQLPEELFL